MNEVPMIHYNASIDSRTDKPYKVKIQNTKILHKDFFKYANNYYIAAEKIQKYLINESGPNGNIYELDLWYFAVMFLYRHSIELLLKSILFKLEDDIEKVQISIEKYNHNLEQIFKDICSNDKITIENNINYEWLLNYFKQISLVDETSDLFRYPFGRDLTPSFKEQTSISLHATYNNMAFTFNNLKNVYTNGIVGGTNYTEYEPDIFISTNNYYGQSVVGYKFAKKDFYPYITSYIEVANKLYEYILKEKCNELFLPMCYLYRNCVEISIKNNIILLYSDFNEAIKIINSNKHKINKLYKNLRKKLENKDILPDDIEMLDIGENYINEIFTIDSSSTLFRYPCYKKLNFHYVKEKYYDVINVSEYFQEIIVFLDIQSDIISALNEYEMQEYYNYY